jgi:hypothetical protein
MLAPLTPFCSCGTTAIVLGMLATRTPWAPIVAFMVTSPLTSPEELLLSAGLFGWPFALMFFTGTIALGFAAGAVTDLLERAGWLAGQARIRHTQCTHGTCPAPAQDPPPPAGCGNAPAAARTGITARLRLPELARELRGSGRRLALYFIGYSVIGFLVTGAGTSIGAITGAFVIARARVIALVVALLFTGALVLGELTGAILG